MNSWNQEMLKNREASKYAILPTLSKVELWLIALSGLMIFVAWDSSFNMQVILPIVILLLVTWIVKKPWIDVTTIVLCAAFIASASFSTLFNIVENPQIINSKSIIRLVYTSVILVYYCLATERQYDAESLRIIVAGSIICGVAISIGTIVNYLNGADGKIAPINVFGEEVAENSAGAQLAFCLALLLSTIRYTTSFKRRLCLSAIAIVLGFALLLTGSRAAYLGIGLSVAIMLLQLLMNARIGIVTKIVIIAAFTLLVIVFIKNARNVLPDFAYNRLFNPHYDDYSNETRLTLWTNGINGFLSQPLFGFGIGNFNYFVTNGLGMTEHVVVVSHNTYIDCLVDVGLVGTVVMVVLLVRGLKGSCAGGVLIPELVSLAFTALIIGGERTYFFWQGVVILTILAAYSRVHGVESLELVFDLSQYKVHGIRQTDVLAAHDCVEKELVPPLLNEPSSEGTWGNEL